MKGALKSDFIFYLKEDINKVIIDGYVEPIMEFKEGDVVDILKTINDDMYGFIYVVFNAETYESVALHSSYVDIIEE